MRGASLPDFLLILYIGPPLTRCLKDYRQRGKLGTNGKDMKSMIDDVEERNGVKPLFWRGLPEHGEES